MPGRFTRVLLAAAICLGSLTATSAAADAAIGLKGASALSAAPAPAARQASTPGKCPTGIGLDAPLAAQEQAMDCFVEEAREKWGLPPLTDSPPLRDSAIGKGWDLVRCNEFSHTACGREFSYWIGQSGYLSSECWRVGENLAWGIDEQGTVASIFRAWMRSPGHRENILGDFEETGIELRVGELGGLAGVHVWVQHFGSHCGS